MREISYDRPVKATLHVHLENGETWEATPADLEKFNIVNRNDAYYAFECALGRVLRTAGLLSEDQEITDAALNPLRYFVEIAIASPSLLEHSGHNGWADVVNVERVLQLHASAVEVP